VYLITPDCEDTKRLERLVAAAIGAGAGAVQYRNKTAAPSLRSEQARALVRVVQSAGLAFFVDNDAALAIDVGADGLHIGRQDGDPAAVRATLPPAMMLGVSCYADLALVAHAVTAGAAYVALGAMFPSKTKIGAAIAPVGRIGEARRLGAHVVASGGIGRDNIAQIAAAGAQAVGVVSAVFDADDAARATADLVARFAMGVQGR
jgi:thiamine-phosphate pyrophosphorylase